MRVRIIREKFFQIIGMCQRAGKLVSGSFASEECIRQGKAHLTILSTDASKNTKKRFSDMCSSMNVQIIIAGSREQLGQCIGKQQRTVMVVLDKGFKDMIIGSMEKTALYMGVNSKWQK